MRVFNVGDRVIGRPSATDGRFCGVTGTVVADEPYFGDMARIEFDHPHEQLNGVWCESRFDLLLHDEINVGDRIEVDVHKERAVITGEALHGAEAQVVGFTGKDLEVRLDTGDRRYVDRRIVHVVKPAKPEWAERHGAVVRSALGSTWSYEGRGNTGDRSVGWYSTAWPHDGARTYEQLVQYLGGVNRITVLA